ncbi:MAG: polymer-forming cytoskeletal protein [Patescibacteria group bacterium]|nr:polymer-forming cytoskeletal protein [Patescibacteria group bacterium]MBU1870817.1 polymer-forming cytoskeletal protein [Patescibacteria group bacterium]
MFNNQNQEKGFKDIETIIGPSVKVKGDFHGTGNIIIEGIVEGNLKTNGNLQVGNKAKITANIEAKEAKISGEIRGNIKINGYLEITTAAKFFGDIETSSLSIEQGAIINGKITMPIEKEGLKKIV